jgi:hypothetical protein
MGSTVTCDSFGVADFFDPNAKFLAAAGGLADQWSQSQCSVINNDPIASKPSQFLAARPT